MLLCYFVDSDKLHCMHTVVFCLMFLYRTMCYILIFPPCCYVILWMVINCTILLYSGLFLYRTILLYPSVLHHVLYYSVDDDKLYYRYIVVF